LAYKYIFIFAFTVYDMYLAKKSRLVGPESSAHTRRWIAGRMAFLFNKSQHRCEEVFKAMQQRGFSGSISLRRYRVFTGRDWIVGSLLLCAGIVLLFI
jgi:cobalt/nickel transport system permease protein